MKSSTRYSRSIIRTGVALSLLISLLSPSALAFSFFKKKQPVEELPPAANNRPKMMEIPTEKPHQVETPASSAGQPAQPVSGSAAGRPRLAPIDPIKELSDKGVFTPEIQAQATPITRAQLAEVMVKALNHDTTLFSEFPFYRDVLLTDPAYASIEVARSKRLINYPEDHGFYYPEKPITFGDLYLVISNAVTGEPPSEERAAHLLRNIPERTSLTTEQYNAVSKMAQSRFFSRVRRYETQFQPVEQEVTPQTMAPFISFMMFLNQRRTPIGAGEEILPELPGGLRLVVSPSTGILEERLKAGGRIRFQLVNAVETIPKGSMLRGVVQEALPNRIYRIVFDGVRTTEGQNYSTRAELSIAFSAKDKLGFIVPGETFEILTQPVTAAEQVEPMQNGEGVTPPSTPEKNVPNREVLKQPVKTIPK